MVELRAAGGEVEQAAVGHPGARLDLQLLGGSPGEFTFFGDTLFVFWTPLIH